MEFFRKIEAVPELPKMEERILEFWKEKDLFKRSVDRREGCERFIFVEGPPTANGIPHPGHIMTRAVKDLILRYKTMCGYHVPRKAGWDTHGLPVEIEVEKELNLRNKWEIEEYGIENFNRKCRESVFRYEREWVRATERIGLWIDMDNPYITFKNEYIESVWWSLKEIWNRGLFYRGRRVVPYCPRCETPLSSHEVAQGYKEIEDPSIFVKFKLEGEDTYILAWTTTPWTLLANIALAVHPDHTYVLVEHGGERLVLAEERLDVLEGNYEILGRFQGIEIEGKRYEPLFEYAEISGKSHVIITADFVTLDEGTGVVHIAPAFGEDDYAVCAEYDLGFTQPVNPDGRFSDEIPPLKGLFVRDADEEIISMLEKKGLLYKREKYSHKYPFCWRCDSPLLYYARESWFIKMTAIRDDLLRNNEMINWYPGHIKHGRFGNFLENVVDWAISRERYWGTPLNIWICECGKEYPVGSIKELLDMAIDKPKELDLHRPYVDKIILKCPECGGKMRRVPDVIDCWYDSGSAPFAQWHYPFGDKEVFFKNFPATFITEAIDQTRGWFYSLLAVSTAVFNEPPYLNVLSLGHVLDEKGVKMSKSRGNVVDPWVIFEREGADALRWYLFSANAPWEDIRFYEEAVKNAFKRFIGTLWNVYFFFVTYANIDKFVPGESVEEKPFLDRWLISRLNRVIGLTREYLERYEIHKAAREIEKFVVDELSNWYIRRSRRRFWKTKFDEDKKSAYVTLYEVLVTLSKLLAPFIPFLAEEIYQNLTKEESVHLCDYPAAKDELIDEEIEKSMELLFELVEAGRSAKASAGIKIRQPLSELVLICSDDKRALIEGFVPLLKEELNVKEVKFGREKSEFLRKKIKPKYGILGPKYKKKVKKIAEFLKENEEKVSEKLIEEGIFSFELDGERIEITPEDVEMESIEKEGYSVAEADGISLFLNTQITDELKEEGLVRDIVRRIQDMRKEMDLEYTTEIEVSYYGDETTRKAMERFRDYVMEETLATSLEFREGGKRWDIDGREVYIEIKTR
ncbi:MAG: isoleucine--tRNA ligase [Candidatus Syntropharchaeia archaeon]